MIEVDEVILLPSGTEISVEAALGDIDRTINFLEAIWENERDHETSQFISGAMSDLEHVGELVELLRRQPGMKLFSDAEPLT